MAFALAHAEMELVCEVRQAYRRMPVELMERNGVGVDGINLGVRVVLEEATKL